MFRVYRSASTMSVRSVCFALCCALVISSLPFAVASKAGQRAQGPPSQNLPNLDVLRRIRPAAPKAPAPVPATRCRRRDQACKKIQGEISSNQLRLAEDKSLLAYAGNRSLKDSPLPWLSRSTVEPASLTLQGESDLAAAQLDPNNRKGTPGEDLLSRNFNWSLPLISLPGRGGLDLGLTLSYNSLVWTKTGSVMQFDLDWGTPTPGFRLGFPSIQRYFFNTQAGAWSYLLILPSGRHVELRQIPGYTNLYEAVDSSYLHLTYNPSDYTLTLRTTDGLQLRFSYQADEYKCFEIKDRNGNYITINYGAGYAYNDISTIVDTLGRTLTFNYDTYVGLNSITQTRNGQPHAWVTFAYGNQTIQTNFPGLTLSGAMNGGSMSVIKRVGLDDGSVYSFEYNTYCQIKTIRRYSPNVPNPNPQTFPNDYFQRAYTTYNLPPDASEAQSDCPRFTTRTDWAHEWNPGVVTTTYGPNPPNWAWGEVTMPDGTVYKETFATSGWQRGLTTQTETKSGGVAKKWTVFQWTQDNESVSYRLNPRVIETNVYDDAGNRRRTTIEYTSYGLPRDVFEYDAAPNVTRVLRRTRIDYNLSASYTDRRIIGLPSAQYVYDGNGYVYSGGTYNNPGEILFSKVTYDYDLGGEFQVHQGPPVRHDTTNYGSGFVQGRGNLNRMRRWDVTDPNNLAKAAENKTGYNTSGSVIFTRDPLNHQTSISFNDSFSDLVNHNTFAYPTMVTDADNYSSTVQYNYDFGAVTRTQNPKGAVVTRTYDAAGRVDRITNQVNGAYTRYVYPHYLYHVLSYTTVNDLNPANELYSLTLLDGHDRLRAVASENPTSVGQYKAQFNAYDSMGRLWMQSRMVEIYSNWHCAGDDQAFGWGAGLWITYTYDWQGRPKVITDQKGKTKEFDYGGCGCAGGDVVTLKDEGQVAGGNRRQQKIYHDVLGRAVKTQVFEWNGTTVYSTTTNSYNALDQITNIKQQVGEAGTEQNTVITYDGHGRLKTRQLPIYLGNPQSATPYDSYEYYADDTIKKIKDPRDASVEYGYNNRHLVTSITYGAPSGVAATPNVTFGYDEAGNRTSMDDGPGYVSYGYDTLSRLQSETRAFEGLTGNYQVSYTYNLVGQIKTVTDNRFSTTATYTYNKAGELTGIDGTGYGGVSQNNFTASNASIWYRAWGATKQLNYGNGLQINLGYDERLQPTLYRLQTGQSQIRDGSDYQYYDDGRVKFASNLVASSPSITPANAFDRAYNYDHVGRLMEASTGPEARGEVLPPSPPPPNNPYKQISAYDVWGNLTGRTNRLWRIYPNDSATYSNDRRQYWGYDVAGNVVLNPTGNHTYDAASRQTLLTSELYIVGGGQTGHLQQPAIEIAQSYDGDGLLAKRVETKRTEELIGGGPQTEITTTVTTTYYVNLRALGGQVMLELNATGGRRKSYVYAGDARIAEDYELYEGGARYIAWKHSNPVTGTLLKSDNSGSVYDRAELDPFGAEVGNADPYYGDELASYFEIKGNDPLYIDGGDPFDLSGGCELDGLPISCSQLLRKIEVGAVQAQGPTGIAGDVIHLGGGLIYGRYGTGSHLDDEGDRVIDYGYFSSWIVQPQQPQQPSSCETFVDNLVRLGTDPVLSQTNAGRRLGNLARGGLAKAAREGLLRLDGFQQRYIAGGQDGFAQVHIVGVAAATLIGNDKVTPWEPETGFQRAQRQFDEDTQQLNLGLEAQRQGFTTTGQAGIRGYRPEHPIQQYIDEKHAEREDDGAGTFAGHTIAAIRAGRITAEEARQSIFERLCVGQRARR